MLERQVTCLVSGQNMETYNGHVRTPADAIILFEACRIGLLPRVQRRLSEKERQSIKSGSIFVWDEREAGMRRWTDGKSWSASRVSGSFLTYREMEGKRGGNGLSAPLFSGNNPRSNRDGVKGAEQESADDGPDGYRYKPDGLMKQSFSITTSSGQHLHLISYFSRSTATATNLRQPSSDPQLRHIRPEKGMYPESTVQDQNSIPAVTRGPMTSPGFAPAPHQSANLASPYTRTAPAQSQYPGYAPPGWAPPSPMHTPPQHYSPYYHQGGHPPPPQLGQSPLQQMHSAYSPYSHSYPHQQPPMAQTAFDRVPPPLSNSGLPPPPPHGHMYQVPPASNAQSYGYPMPAPYVPQHQPPRLSPPSETRRQQANLPIDPKLSESQLRHDSMHPAKDDTRAGAQNTATLPLQNALPTSSATTIPSIRSLIDGAQAASSEQASARNGSRSPNEQQRAHTQDIPLHKLGFNPNSDATALRNLDKAGLRF